MDARGPEPVTVPIDVADLEPDLFTIDMLARLALVARRHGGRLTLDNASSELLELIELAGLGDVLRRRSKAPRY